MNRAALIAALPQRAAQALAAARLFDTDCDAAAAFIAAADHPDASVEELARFLRSQTRRERRAGGPHGPARFLQLDVLHDDLDGDGDPALLVEAAEAVAACAGLQQALEEREPASDTRALSQRDGITQRRAQQVLAVRRETVAAGQMSLLED